MSTKDQHHDYRILIEHYLTDIDMSGGLEVEYQEIIPKIKNDEKNNV